MMLSSFQLPSLNLGSGTAALMMLGVGAALAVAVILIVAAFRRAGSTELTNALWGGGFVLTGAVLAALLIERPATTGADGDRRAIERQAAELTARAIMPGSALACLDSVVSAITDACEKAVFAKPDAVAAAVDYTDARLSLLAASVALADRDPSLRPLAERLRGAVEADRFGLVAHVLMTRGCKGPDCDDLKLLRDPARVLANMNAQAFEARLGVHALAWQENGAATASMRPPSPNMPPVAGVGPGLIVPSAPTTSGTSGGARLDFPSAASIPAVNIMNPEPGLPPVVEPKPAVAPKRPPQPAQPTQPRQATQEPARPSRGAVQQRSASPAPQQSAVVPPRPIAPPPVQSAPESEPPPLPEPRGPNLH